MAGAAAWTLAEQDTPLIAARHAGRTLDPQQLAAQARRADAVALTAPPLAPLTPRSSVRDVAAALAEPVVLALPARPGVTGEARGLAEVARGGGLTVAAVVLTGWPEPASRVLMDEREVLYETSDLPVLLLSAGGDASGLALGELVDEAREALPASVAVAAKVTLEPYRAWDGDVPGDPRETPRPRIMEALAEIIATEGPMRASRAYAIYNRASGGKKLTAVARAPLSSALTWLAREGKVELTPRDDIPWQDDDLVRLPDAPPVVVRELGPRELIEVPLDEIAELMRRLGGPDKRTVLTAYGLVRLTSRADEYLGLAAGLLEDG